jgi:hypothetical protein
VFDTFPGRGILNGVKAQQLFRFKGRQGEVLVEMVIWALPGPTSNRAHGLKYRLYCGRDGHCLVRYDNEAGKGDHRHYGEIEEPYHFESLDRLVADFRNDCARLAGWRWQ